MASNSFLFTETAERDLDEIISYISVSLCNPGAARAFYDKLAESIRTTCNYPESGSPVINDFLKENGVRKQLIGNYVMYYCYSEQKHNVLILRIVYGKRNPDDIIKSL